MLESGLGSNGITEKKQNNSKIMESKQLTASENIYKVTLMITVNM